MQELKFNDINNDPSNVGKIYLGFIENAVPTRKFFVKYDGDNRFVYLNSNREVPAVFPDQFADNPNDVTFVEIKLPQVIVDKIISHGAYYGGNRKKTRKTRRKRLNKRKKSNRKN
jgi:hypothetical protein